MPLDLGLRRQRKRRIGDAAIAAFQAASQIKFSATRASSARIQSSLAPSVDTSDSTGKSRADLEPSPPRDLWDEAYEALRTANSKLTEQYEESIMRVDQGGTHLAPIGSISRQEQLSVVIARRLDYIEKDQYGVTVAGRKVVLQEQMDKFIQIVMFAKDFVSSTVSAEPHAALAWAGICVLLPVSIKISHRVPIIP